MCIRDRLKITLLDSLNKRVGFLNEVIEALDLKDIEAVHGRDVYKRQHEDMFDSGLDIVVIARVAARHVGYKEIESAVSYTHLFPGG